MNHIKNLNINFDYLNLNLEKMKLVEKAIGEIDGKRLTINRKIDQSEHELEKMHDQKARLIKLKRTLKIAISVLVVDIIAIPFAFAASPIMSAVLTLSGIGVGLHTLRKSKSIQKLAAAVEQNNKKRLTLEYNLPDWKDEFLAANITYNKLQEEKKNLSQEQRKLQQQHAKDFVGLHLQEEQFDIVEPNRGQDYPLNSDEKNQLKTYNEKILQLKKIKPIKRIKLFK